MDTLPDRAWYSSQAVADAGTLKRCLRGDSPLDRLTAPQPPRQRLSSGWISPFELLLRLTSTGVVLPMESWLADDAIRQLREVRHFQLGGTADARTVDMTAPV